MKTYLSLIKFAHTVFALPFAFLAFFLAVRVSREPISWILFLKVLLCMIFARSAAMAFNRYADRKYDALNLRTAVREIPRGEIKPSTALLIVGLNALGFVLASYSINKLVFVLSPVALFVILGYSYSKRFTWLCHFILGVALGLAPIGAYAAVTGQFHFLSVGYGVMVMLWVAGFDILYALQDEDFDRENKLHSVPAQFGGYTARRIAMGVHLCCAAMLFWLTFEQSKLLPSFGWIHWAGAFGFFGLLIWQHMLVARYGLEKINQAFFETNGIASLMFGASVILDVLT